MKYTVYNTVQALTDRTNQLETREHEPKDFEMALPGYHCSI